MSPTERYIRPDQLSSKPAVFEGTLLPGDLDNLAGDLANGDGELRYRVTARLDSAQRRTVSCIINGFVFLTCQTTSAPFRHEVAIDDRLVLVGSDEELPAFEEEGDQEDFVVVDSPLDVRGLVEEAVILSLPMVPRKPGLDGGADAAPETAEKPSPFAALAGLKRPK